MRGGGGWRTKNGKRCSAYSGCEPNLRETGDNYSWCEFAITKFCVCYGKFHNKYFTFHFCESTSAFTGNYFYSLLCCTLCFNNDCYTGQRAMDHNSAHTLCTRVISSNLHLDSVPFLFSTLYLNVYHGYCGQHTWNLQVYSHCESKQYNATRTPCRSSV